MINWLGLLLSPMITLGCLGLVYAMATPACAWQAAIWIHAVFAAALAITCGLTWRAWHYWRQTNNIWQGTEHASARVRRPPSLIIRMGVWNSLLFSVVILAMWISVWLMPPCLQ